jgi:two-component system phosphate regulon sensor histidine kinase PhoR
MKVLAESIKEKSIEVNIKTLWDVNLMIAPEHANILVHNLIENAIKYNVLWWKIGIELTEKSLTISDTWIWISKEHQTKIFDRFYRINHSQQNGNGIGLALIAKICSIYHMRITVKSDEWLGSTFKITF